MYIKDKSLHSNDLLILSNILRSQCYYVGINGI